MVITRSNGFKLTITPALQESAASMQRKQVEEQRLANAAGKSKARTQIRTMLKCPFGMPSCNRKSHACEQCRAELGLPARSQKNRAPNKFALMRASRKLASGGSAGAGSSSDA